MVVSHHLQKKLIIDVSKSELSWVHSQGYVWFHEIFIPTLEKAASASLIPKETLSLCYYIAGDVTEINNAPKKALEYYRKALSCDSDSSATYREIANMLTRIGRYDEALKYSNKAIALDPDDVYALNDREDILAGGFALYEQGDVLWNVCEHLANADHAKALAIVKDMNDVIGLRGKLYCYGASDEAKKYLETWSELTKISDEIGFTYEDWFFMPDYIYKNPDIWTILLSSNAEFTGCTGFIESLENSNNKTYHALRESDKVRLSFQYEKYCNSKNHKALKLLSETYPEWVELKEGFPPYH